MRGGKSGTNPADHTQGVAEVCRQIQQNPDLAYKYTMKSNTIAIVTDGSAVLGLGNTTGYKQKMGRQRAATGVTKSPVGTPAEFRGAVAGHSRQRSQLCSNTQHVL